MQHENSKLPENKRKAHADSFIKDNMKDGKKMLDDYKEIKKKRDSGRRAPASKKLKLKKK